MTRSTQGVYIYSKEVPEGEFINTKKSKMVDSTGAGDGLAAGISYGLYHNYKLYQAVQIGLIISALTVTSPDAVYSRLDEAMLKRQIVRMFRIL